MSAHSLSQEFNLLAASRLQIEAKMASNPLTRERLLVESRLRTLAGRTPKPGESRMIESLKTSFGRWQADQKEDGFNIYVEINGSIPDKDFWLPVIGMNGVQLGHIFFMSLSPGCFQVDGLRPVSCPMQDRLADCTQPLCRRQEEP